MFGWRDLGTSGHLTRSVAGAFLFAALLVGCGKNNFREILAVDVAGPAGSELRSSFEIPAGAQGLRFELLDWWQPGTYTFEAVGDLDWGRCDLTPPDGADRNADLYVAFGREPTLSDYDCSSTEPGESPELCELDTALHPDGGTYHALVYGVTSFCERTLRANYRANGGGGVPSEPLFVENDVFEGDADERLGQSVALSGSTAVVGTNANRARVFVRNASEWSEQQTLLPPQGIVPNSFGATVAIDGDTIVVGDPNASEEGTRRGRAYVFMREGSAWILQQTLWIPESNDYASVGRDVFVHGTQIIIAGWSAFHVFDKINGTWELGQSVETGSHGDMAFDGTTIAFSTGSTGVVVYERSGVLPNEWLFAQTLLPSNDLWRSWGWGESISVRGDTMVFSGRYNLARRAFVFVRDSGVWTEHQRLISKTEFIGKDFGCGTAVEGDLVAVGSCVDYQRFTPGNVTLFRRNGDLWVEGTRLTGGESAAHFDYFGEEIALEWPTLVVGAPRRSPQPAMGAFFFAAP